MGDVTRFQHGRQVASYPALIPSEHSSSKGRRPASISKPGNPFPGMLLVERVQTVCHRGTDFASSTSIAAIA
jgi:transposase